MLYKRKTVSAGKKNHENGFSLIELLVSLSISIVGAAAIFSFVQMAGKNTDELIVMQQLQQEASMISELLTREIRNSRCVTINGNILPPANINGEVTTAIDTRDMANTIRTTFAVTNDTLRVNNNVFTTAYQCEFVPGSASFTVFPVIQLRQRVTFQFTLSKTYKANGITNTRTLTRTTGQATCRG